jgi:outer membrane protein assembly factor BamB
MRRIVTAAVIVMAVLACGAAAQYPGRALTHPKVPTQDALDRVHLKLAWSGQAPIDGARDGFLSIQLAGDNSELLVVQTCSGAVAAFDAVSGEKLWTWRPARSYTASAGVVVNHTHVMFVNDLQLIALNRKDGTAAWDIKMPGAPAAPPVGDDTRFYCPVGHEGVFVLKLKEDPPRALDTDRPPVREVPPKPDVPKDDMGKGDPPKPAPPPENQFVPEKPASAIAYSSVTGYTPPDAGDTPYHRWVLQMGVPIGQAPIISKAGAYLWSPGGSFLGVARDGTNLGIIDNLRAGVSFPVASRDAVVYVPGTDLNLYAIALNTAEKFATGGIRWRYPVGTRLARPPVCTDDEVFVVTEKDGLRCINREDSAARKWVAGDERWRNGNAVRVVSANEKFVYASNPVGQLLVLDRIRGTQLSTTDATCGFIVPFTNERTDRLYLMSQNGLIVSLYDRDYPKPVISASYRVKEETKLPPPKPEKPKDGEVEKPKGGDKPG